MKTQTTTTETSRALIALAGGDEAAIHPDEAVYNQLHKTFHVRTMEDYRLQSASRLDALREFCDRSLRYHVIRLQYQPLEEDPVIVLSYAMQDLMDAATKLADLQMDCHMLTVATGGLVDRSQPTGASLIYATRHGLGPDISESLSYYATGEEVIF